MQDILKINLSNGNISSYPIPVAWQQEYLGGASLAARLLYDHLSPQVAPLDPQAPLLFLNGPLSGTAGPAVGRFVICGRSPATGLWGESNCGGFWGPELRQAGYDGLWIEGRAQYPVYLWIQDERVEIREASHLWGLDTYQTQEAIAKELQAGKVRTATIGPAGEALIPFALVLADHGRVAGRTGMGALMGSKNLKAVVVQGKGKIPLAEPQRYTELRSRVNRELRNNATAQVLRELGTAGVAEYMDYLGEMPKQYFSRGWFGEELNISGAAMKDSMLSGVSACHACVIACGRVVRLADGEKRKGPEYETIAGFGPNLMLNDLELTVRLGELCDRFGIDSISMSNTLGLAYRLFELGKISLEDTGGLKLAWGDGSALETLIAQTVQRQGLGAYLAQGARALGAAFGAEDEAVQVNGLEVAYHDPRGASGMALVYATSPRGGCHNQSDYFLVDIGQVESELGLDYYERLGGAEKAANVARHQDWRTIANALVMCLFANIPPHDILDLVNAACGGDYSLEDLLRCGERGWNLKRLVNIKFGLSAKNDQLPAALLRAYIDDPQAPQGFIPSLQPMLSAYYAARDWDANSGAPNSQKLKDLGLIWTQT